MPGPTGKGPDGPRWRPRGSSGSVRYRRSRQDDRPPHRVSGAVPRRTHTTHAASGEPARLRSGEPIACTGQATPPRRASPPDDVTGLAYPRPPARGPSASAQAGTHKAELTRRERSGRTGDGELRIVGRKRRCRRSETRPRRRRAACRLSARRSRSVRPWPAPCRRPRGEARRRCTRRRARWARAARRGRRSTGARRRRVAASARRSPTR